MKPFCSRRMLSVALASLVFALFSATASQAQDPISDLICDVSGNDITLSWTNNDEYDSIEVAGDAGVWAVLSGDDTEETILAVPNGIRWVHVYALDAAGAVIGVEVSCLCGFGGLLINAPTCTVDAVNHEVNMTWTMPRPYSDIGVIHEGATTLIAGNSLAHTITDLCYGEHEVELQAYILGDPVWPTASCSFTHSGPPPIANLQCVEFAPEDVRITWDLPAVPDFYDNVVITQDGVEIADLPGALNLYEAYDLAVGTYEFCLEAFFAGASVCEIACCEVTIETPQPITTISCTSDRGTSDGLISWTNPSLYDELQVSIGGELHETLAGDAEEYAISLTPDEGAAVLLISVVGLVNDLEIGPPATCILDITGPLPVEDLTCTIVPGLRNVLVTWSNPSEYEELFVQTEGEILEPITSTSTSAIIVGLASKQQLVCVVGTIGGWAEETCCVFDIPKIFLRGDADESGLVDGNDINFIVNAFIGGPWPSCESGADANDDGAVTLNDATYLVDFLLLGGPAPGTPSGACGVESTDDALDCLFHGACP